MPERRSVTEQDRPYALVGPLPKDFLAAFNLAVVSACLTDSIVFAARQVAGEKKPGRPSPYGSIIAASIESIRFEYPYHNVLEPVLNELTLVSEPSARFGATNAHVAAIEYQRRVVSTVWLAADPLQHAKCYADASERMDIGCVGRHLDRVCEAVAEGEWPDGRAIVTACTFEAVRAAAAREHQNALRTAVGSPFKSAPGKSAAHCKKGRRPAVPEKYKAAVKLWPEYKAEREGDRRRATFADFRVWLTRRRPAVFVDDRFAVWWRNSYSPQLRR